MKNAFIALSLILSTSAMADQCLNTVNSIGIVDSFAAFCKGACNVAEALGPVFKKEGKKGSLTPTARLVGSDSTTRRYSLVVKYTDDSKVTKQISNYDVVTSSDCFVQSITRKKLDNVLSNGQFVTDKD